MDGSLFQAVGLAFGRKTGFEREGAIRACKVMRVCPKCDKPTRPAHKFAENGAKLTVCKHCGETL